MGAQVSDGGWLRIIAELAGGCFLGNMEGTQGNLLVALRPAKIQRHSPPTAISQKASCTWQEALVSVAARSGTKVASAMARREVEAAGKIHGTGKIAFIEFTGERPSDVAERRSRDRTTRT